MQTCPSLAVARGTLFYPHIHAMTRNRVRNHCWFVVIALLLMFGSTNRAFAEFTLVDFSVDAAHANPSDPHEVFFPDFNNFQLTITGTFDINKCYNVIIKRNGGSECGSANSSGVDTAVVSATKLIVDIHPNIDSDFKRANDWEIKVNERLFGCSGDSTIKIHSIPLRIAGCTDACLLSGVGITADPPAVGCAESSRLCAEVLTSSGNLVYDWDTDGDGEFDDLTTFAPENCVDVLFTTATQVGVRVTDLGTLDPDCTSTASTFVNVDLSTCDDGNLCTDDSCDSTTGCLNVDNTDPCNDDNACTQTDTCSDGVCTGSNLVICTAQDQCHDPGTCDPSTGACSNPMKEDDTVCDDDDSCTQTDMCQVGVCVSGSPLDCDDQNVCTDDSCDSTTGCLNVDNTDSCDDGNACTQTDTCSGGVCTGSNLVICTAQDQCHDPGTCDPSTGACSNPMKPDDTACDDNDSCTQTDTCSSGACTGSNPVICTAQDQCHDPGSCDPSTGACSNPMKADDTACDDNDSCTQADTCQTGVCVSGLQLDCDDQNVCTDDSCDPAVGCVNVDNSSPCDDGNTCTQTDTCSGGVCTGSNLVICTAQDQCHDPGTCNPSTGVCSNPVKPDDTACDDDDSCTQTDMCQVGVCVSGSPLDCDDQNVCTDDSCDSTVGCVNTDKPKGTACGDPSETICDNADTCDGLGSCQTNLKPDRTLCDSDGFSCTDDFCTGGVCTHANVCPGRDTCPFDPTCPEAMFHLAVLEEPSDLTCGDGRPDCTEINPPANCQELLRCGSTVTVEIWVTKFSPDLDPTLPINPGIACAYVDLLSHVPVAAEHGFEYGPAFDAGPNFESGTFDGDGGITELGACSTTEGGVGVWPEWVLLARVEVEQVQGEDLSFELQESVLFSTSVFGEGAAEPVHYGQRCDSSVFCRAHTYDIDDDCFIGPGDLACCAGCWLLCPDDPEYPTGACGESCDVCNFLMCDPEDCFGPEDFAFWVTCWLKFCNDTDCILVPDDVCTIAPATAEALPPLPSDKQLRSLGLEPPRSDWKGYRRGILREWELLEAELEKRRPMKRKTRPVVHRIEQ